MNPIALNQYAAWLPGRAKRPFLTPEHAVIVAMKDPTDAEDQGVLVAAVSLFPTKGLFLMVEQCATNPEVPARVRHAAVEFMFEAVRTYAAIVGKLPFMITNKLGLYKLAKKHGWVPHERAAVLECDPLHPVVPLNKRGPRTTNATALSPPPPRKVRGRVAGGVRQRSPA